MQLKASKGGTLSNIKVPPFDSYIFAPPNVYWMNTFFFNGGFAVKVSF